MTPVSTIDGRTAEAVREAITAATAGRTEEARRIAEHALADGGDSATLNAFLGSLHLNGGDVDAAIRHLRHANSARPADPVIAFNLATALSQHGDHSQALQVLTRELSSADVTMRIERLRGFLAQTVEEFELAIQAYERVVAADAADLESWNNLGNARRCIGDFDGSIDALRRAVELDPSAAPVRLNLCTALAAAGRKGDAEREFRAMADAFPQDWRPLRELHALLRTQGREEEALEAIEEASRRAPDDLELLLAVASQRLLLLDNVCAEKTYREVVQRDPANPLGNLGLAVVFELTNQADELAALIPEAESRCVNPDALNFIRAFDHRRAKRYAEGVAALEQVPDALDTARRAHLAGQLYEGVGNYDQAWTAFTRMNEIQRDDPSQPEIRAAAFRNLIRLRLSQMTPEWAKSWRSQTGSSNRKSPVFLVGFPRSGTTLLDTFLMGHSEVVVLEEEPTIHRAGEILTDFAELPHMPAKKIDAAKDIYFNAVADLTQLAPGNLLIDKNPLLMTVLPLIKRLFSDARIILAVRHPCDVVLSCFATNFKLNDAMSSFLRLETAAELYDLSFSIFERAQDLLSLPTHSIWYENLIANPEHELKKLSSFLDIEWNADVLDHQTTARKRGRIKTASYAQVVEPIYTRSSGRWQNYRKHLEPVFSILEPWARKFGYEL